MTEKQALRAEYRRLRRNYRQMIRRDYEKYLIPKDITRFIPDIPRIISDPTAFKNAAVSRVQSAVNNLLRNIEGYKRYRTTFERLDDAYLRNFESVIINATNGILSEPSFVASYNRMIELDKGIAVDSLLAIERANKILNVLRSEVDKGKIKRHLIAQRILKRWDRLVDMTVKYIYGYSASNTSGKKDFALFKAVVTLIFKPDDGEDGYFLSVWENINDILKDAPQFYYGDDGTDDPSETY